MKLRAHDTLAAVGIELCDCPVSGTGAQMADRDAVFYASGDAAALAIVEPVLASCARRVFNVGALGNGTKLKLVANHLVAVHNASAAEAIALARAAGLDLQEALPALVAGAGTSRMLELRGPMMVAGEYEPPTVTVDVFMKDIEIITAFGREVQCPLPVFAAAAQLHLAAQACGWGGSDTASVHAVIEKLAGS
jgi:L-threonate 2-dehydrogenase